MLEKDFIANYYANEDYVLITIFSKYIPFIYTDINKNNVIDPYIEKLFSVSQGEQVIYSTIELLISSLAQLKPNP